IGSKTVISIRRFLSENEAHEALVRVVQLLLQGMSLHVVEGDPDDHEVFRNDINQLMASVTEEIGAAEVIALAGQALKVVETYNRRTTRFVRQPAMELQAMVKM